MSLANIVRGVFDVQRQDLVVGDRVPSWFTSDRWDITALAPPTAAVSQQQIKTMLQNLLIERFKLVTRRERRDMPMYALVVARSDRRLGPQMKPSTADCAALAGGVQSQWRHSADPGLKRVRRQVRPKGGSGAQVFR
jgi:uncharacterized protein (TIGR03435 family)